MPDAYEKNDTTPSPGVNASLISSAPDASQMLTPEEQDQICLKLK